MIVNIIIQEIQKTGMGFKNGNLSYFFADDGMLMATRVRKMEVPEVAGLKINVEKCKTMIFQRRKNLTINQIGGIEVVNEVKYLGVIINNASGCFRRHKEEKIKQTRRMVNMTYSVVHKSCNKLMIGKTYWKSVVMPAVLMGSSVVC